MVASIYLWLLPYICGCFHIIVVANKIFGPGPVFSKVNKTPTSVASDTSQSHRPTGASATTAFSYSPKKSQLRLSVGDKTVKLRLSVGDYNIKLERFAPECMD